MLVDFLIIGAQRCGTTTLFDILRSHPAIVAADRKEPEFFSLVENWREHLGKYHRLFRQQPGALYFEASTSYTFYPLRLLDVWDRIHEYNPRMKFIYLVRNPIDRIISAYILYYQRGFTDLPIEAALQQTRDFLDVSRYYTQIAPYVHRFGPDRVLILDFDDLVHRQDAVVAQVATFLGVSSAGFSRSPIHSNASLSDPVRHRRYDQPALPLRAIRRLLPRAWNALTDNSSRRFPAKPTLGPAHRRMITRVLELEIRGLERLMQKDLSPWLTEAHTGAAA